MSICCDGPRATSSLTRNMPDTRISPQTQVEQSAEVRAVLAALQQLPEMDRTVLLMRALDCV